jgi:hypothetical protein
MNGAACLRLLQVTVLVQAASWGLIAAFSVDRTIEGQLQLIQDDLSINVADGHTPEDGLGRDYVLVSVEDGIIQVDELSRRSDNGIDHRQSHPADVLLRLLTRDASDLSLEGDYGRSCLADSTWAKSIGGGPPPPPRIDGHPPSRSADNAP